MTDSPREEPRPDRLPQIREIYLKECAADELLFARIVARDVRWLVAEVERLRGNLAMAESALAIRRKMENWKDNR